MADNACAHQLELTLETISAQLSNMQKLMREEFLSMLLPIQQKLDKLSAAVEASRGSSFHPMDHTSPILGTMQHMPATLFSFPTVSMELPCHSDGESATRFFKDEEPQDPIKNSKKENLAPLITKSPSESNGLESFAAGFARARIAIGEITQTWKSTTTLQGFISWQSHAFHRSSMENQFTLFFCEGREPFVFHTGSCNSIYSLERAFIHTRAMDSQSRTCGLEKRSTIDYGEIFSTKSSFWECSLGAKAFILCDHDWGPLSYTYISTLYNNAMGSLQCNRLEPLNSAKVVTACISISEILLGSAP